MSKQSEITCGIHAVRHALNNTPVNVLEIWVLENKKPAKGILEILELAKHAQVTVQFVANKTLDKITHQANHQGVAIRRKAALAESKMD